MFPNKSIAANASRILGLSSGSVKRRSSMFHGRPVLKFMPTYRLESKHPFNPEKCEAIIKKVMDESMATFEYNSKSTPTICKHVSEEIKDRIKLLNFDRYKIICVVTIGEKFRQNFNAVVKFLWDGETDGYASYVYDTPKFYAIGTVYALYYD